MSLRQTLSGAKLLLLTLAFVAAANAVITASSLQNPVVLMRDITKHGLWRSANNAYSQRAANFYEFLNNEIPGDTRVLIPYRGSGPVALTEPGIAQFFLYPREVINCTGSSYLECAKGFLNTGTAIVVTNRSEFEQEEELSAHIRPFDKDWALLIQDTGAGGNSQEDFTGLGEVASAFLRGILYFGLLAAPWTYISLRTNKPFGFAMHVAVGFGAGIGWQSLTMALLMIAGITPSAGTILLLGALSWCIALLLHYFRFREIPFGPKPKLNFLAIGFFAALLAAGLVFSVGRGYKVVDEVILWGAKGYGIVAAGLQRGATEWGTRTTSYPLNIPLTISSALLLFDDKLPEAKVVFPMFSAAFIALIYELIRARSNSVFALLCGAIIFTTPGVFFHSTIAYANLPLAFYLLAGTILLNSETLTGKYAGKASTAWGAAMLILAAWTRPEGLILAWAAAAIALLLNRRTISRRGSVFWLTLLPLAAYSIFWLISSRFIYTRAGFTSGAPGDVWRAFSAGNFHINELTYLLTSQMTELFSSSEWGLLSFLATGMVIAFAVAGRRSRNTLPFYLTGGASVVLVLAIYYAFSFLNRPQDISWWVNTGLTRMTMPGILLIMAGAFTQLATLFMERRTVKN